MRSRRSSLLRLLLWMCLVLLALRPVPRLEGAVGIATSPLRVLAEPAYPLVWLRSRRVHAEDEGAHARAARNSAEIEALGTELLQLARPATAELAAGRDLVPAEVVGRAEEDRDRILVRVTDTTALVPGLPVVYGDHFVGRVGRVDGARREVEVDLVTGPDFSVGARLIAEGLTHPVWMTVGGVWSSPGRATGAVERLALVVSNPSDREAPAGRVVVGELLPDIDPFAYLAEGYELGHSLALPPNGERVVLADVDYGAGLYHVTILCPPGSRAGADDSLEMAVSDFDWRPTRALSAGVPSNWRGGFKVAAGRSAGVEPGAAVIRGLRLFGRVERVGAWSADVRLLSDPGLSLVAVARVEGETTPRVLGRLVSLGAGAEDEWIRFRWEAVVGTDLAAGEGAVARARLFSGAGDSGLPVGLFLGEARLSSRVDPEVGAPVVELRREDDLAPEELWVRTRSEGHP